MFQRLCVAGSVPVEIQIYTDKTEAIAHHSAIKTLLAPHTIEGSNIIIGKERTIK